MKSFITLSLKHKLTLLIMLISIAALLLACVAVLSYELLTFRGSMVQSVSILAEVIGSNCSAAVVFGDSKAAEETLAALAAEPHIVSAQIHGKDSEVLAKYARDKSAGVPAYPAFGQKHVFIGEHLFLSLPIVLDQERVGSITIQSDLRAMDERVQRYAGIVTVVLLLSTGAAFLLSRKLQHIITAPILHLVETVQAVSAKKDYAIRASKQSDDELGLLSDSFNEMLARIHQHEHVLNTALREKEVLLKEVHHRVKNNLQVISSLLNLQSGFIKEPEVLVMFTESMNRIKSMALIHEKLYQSKDFAKIDFAEYVRNLTNHLYRSYVINSNLIKFEIHVEDVSLNVDTAIPCGLMLNELVSNSLKYAFPNGRTGEISIRLFRQEGNQLILLVKDNGVGLPKDIDFKSSKSLGLKLVNILTQQLRGDLNYHSENGTEFRLAFQA
ncbi:MAG: histidine kinase dimerization/phosphoacceptor domain -containing protein [candidate division KSB1 bacterium]